MIYAALIIAAVIVVILWRWSERGAAGRQLQYVVLLEEEMSQRPSPQTKETLVEARRRLFQLTRRRSYGILEGSVILASTLPDACVDQERPAETTDFLSLGKMPKLQDVQKEVQPLRQ